jgi:hypothetical protein
MKYCPSCQSTFADDSLRFCLQDGTGLLDYADNAPAPTVDFNETETVVRRKPETSAWQPSRVTQNTPLEPEAKKSSAIPAVVVTILVMSFLFGGIFIAWQLFASGSASDNTNRRGKFPSPTLTPTSTPKTTPSIDRTPIVYMTPTPVVGELWHPTDNNASLTGENLTYYRGTTPEQCKLDCEKNPACKGFGLIRAGFYNASDPPMCYLLSKVTGSTPSPCCISGIKSEVDLDDKK